MEKLAYTRGDDTFALVVTADAETYATALAMLAECFKGQVNDGDQLPVVPGAVEYAIHYGLKQSLQDSAAQPAAEARAEGEDVAAATREAMTTRFTKLIAGEVSVRDGVGATRDPFESMVRSITRKQLAAWAKSKGKKLPKDKEKLAALRAKFYAGNKDSIDAAAKAALAAESKIEVEFDID